MPRDSIRFLVMELLEGETLQRRLARGSLDATEVIGIRAALCDALDAAHAKGILHRDIKPANVFLTGHGQDPCFGKRLAITRPLGVSTDVILLKRLQ